MKKFTFISEYKGGTYISQHEGYNASSAVRLWAKNLDSSIYNQKDIINLLNEVEMEEYQPTSIKALDNVWCCTFLSKKSFLLLNIIETT